ncbi:type II toxin-antitoxin system RelE/ParE family toxin [Aurantimonas sp. VKM B-3413]|uniref:type II toxin-antitoxin system RelE/ParE family toxin n=1 Tax=Aurantimonas sp. VKM B-3413 TaxID=2779401 RepID=UPI00351D675C
MKRRSVISTPEAADDLDRIYEIIAGAGSSTAADRYDRRIRAFCDGLEYARSAGHGATTSGLGCA